VAFTYLKVKSAKLFTSGGLGLNNLVLFTSLDPHPSYDPPNTGFALSMPKVCMSPSALLEF